MEQGQRRLEQRLQSLEEGQRLLEEGQQRTNQRLHSLEDKLSGQSEQLRLLTGKMEYESGASKQRDRQLAEDIQRFREERAQKEQELHTWIHQAQQKTLASLSTEVNTPRADHDRRLDQHNTRLEMLEQSASIR